MPIEAESAPAPGMDTSSAAAGDTGVAIQAKDAFSNNLWAGGDFSVLLAHKTDGDVQYRAFVTDHGADRVRRPYRRHRGPYDEITHRGEPLLGCPAPSRLRVAARLRRRTIARGRDCARRRS